MKKVNNKVRFILLGVVLALGAGFAVAAESDDEVALRWALGAWSGDSNSPSAIQRDTQLEAGTRLKFLVEPMSASSVYLILLDAEENVHVLYRESPKLKESGSGDPTYIPPDGQFFELDNTSGMETFFLMASDSPLAELEGLLDEYDAAADSAKKNVSLGIVREIRRLNKAHRNFARPVEKPVMIGGQTRGDADDAAAAIDRLAVEVTAEQYYSKTITIDH